MIRKALRACSKGRKARVAEAAQYKAAEGGRRSETERARPWAQDHLQDEVKLQFYFKYNGKAQEMG